ncbi:TatD family hydrolase [Pseudoflavonifractor phocaeensis]|uniref:TatD family hydrolase n=1 Tax=Pseudoflavonifractor phocaeensis TaxID=1870988 RepID=UPI00313C639B
MSLLEAEVMPMELFDTHAHYYDDAFDADRDAVLSALPAKGVRRVVCPGCDLESSRQSLALAEQYPFLYFAAGLHPENLEGASLADLDEVRGLAAHPKCVAVGEIGLDYYWVKTPEARANSRDFFDAQLSLAEELNLPAIVHDRDAHKDTVDLVRAHPGARGVFHCCALSAEDAKAVVKLGWHVSFTGSVTFKNARRALEVIAAVPLERIMLETDSPYMAPEPFRGRRCDSSYVYRVAETVAQVKGLTPEAVAEATYQNGLRFFGLEDTPL